VFATERTPSWVLPGEDHAGGCWPPRKQRARLLRESLRPTRSAVRSCRCVALFPDGVAARPERLGRSAVLNVQGREPPPPPPRGAPPDRLLRSGARERLTTGRAISSRSGALGRALGGERTSTDPRCCLSELVSPEFSSGCESEHRRSLGILPFGDEFCQGMGCGGTHEKFRQAVA